MQEASINTIQACIVRQLSEHNELRFSEINIENIPSDQFSYHLRQLMKYGLIIKNSNNTYSLSPEGKTRSIMLYPNRDGFIAQGYLAARIVLHKEENGKQYFLMQQRQLVPYKGSYSTPGDKIIFGEDVAVAAKRIMKQQTGLEGELSLCGISHQKDDYLNEIVQDKYFFVFAAKNPKGTLLPSGKTGTNLWLTYDEIRSSELTINGVEDVLRIASSNTFHFHEATLHMKSY